MFGWARNWWNRRKLRAFSEGFVQSLRSGETTELLIVHRGLSQAERESVLKAIEDAAGVVLEHKYSMLITPGEGRTGVKVVPSPEISSQQAPPA
jgi:hypothetical protein